LTLKDTQNTQTNDNGDPVIFNRVAYLPYLDSLMRKGSQKGKTWVARFQGGEVDLHLPKLEAVMIYGSSGEVPVEFLADAGETGTSVVFHTRHKKSPLMLCPRPRTDRKDVLTGQIKARESKRKRLVIAKALVTARIRQMIWLLPGADDCIPEIRQTASLKEVRALEAQYTRRYWHRFYSTLGMPEEFRRGDNSVSDALNALSAFTGPLFTRWLTVHALSPNHGYLHEPTSYEALVYDLMETVRHWMEQSVYQEVLEGGLDNLTERATTAYKHMLEDWVEVPSLQVSAKRKFVLYGMVLGLRSYLLGEVNHVHFPLDSLVRSKGRPVKVAYQIPGAVKRLR